MRTAGSTGALAAPSRLTKAEEQAGHGIVARVDETVSAALAGTSRVVLAVSGGRDSMVLLDAVARTHLALVAGVATYDHGTGEAATRAAALVARRARALGLPVHSGRADRPAGSEAAWRDARWRFLREVAHAERAAIATAHTRDDQVETVLMRALRGAGARGLAGLYAEGDVLRPLLQISRADVAAYARARHVEWVEDPSNQSRRYLRNRVRLDLLPALERARPGLSEELLELACRAATLRGEVEQCITAELAPAVHDGILTVARASLLGYDGEGLRLLWPALAGRLGLALDRRGTERAAEFTTEGKNGGRIQLSGGYEAVLHRGNLVLRRASASGGLKDDATPLGRELSLSGWRFCRVEEANGETSTHDLWTAHLPVDAALRARSWRPGDRMTPLGATTPRRVKGLLRDAGIDAASRVGWPVVLVGDEIVWIPGVRRSSAATARSGRPVALYLCERDH
jgi:tRNA(Ile)-lysidine synthase